MPPCRPGGKSGVLFPCMLFFDSASIIPPSPVNPLMAKPPLPAHSSFCHRSILFNPFTLSIFPWPFASQSPSSISHLSHPSTPPPSILLLLPLLLLVLYPCQTDKKTKKHKKNQFTLKGPRGIGEDCNALFSNQEGAGGVG